MSLNFANGVEFWNVKDNTPQNGSKLTDAQGNELTFGGGGGGDFSTATVTVIVGEETVSLYAANKVDQGEFIFTVGVLKEGNNEVILYKGKALLFVPYGTDSITISGPHTELDGSQVLLTGDCTITTETPK